jgi:BirA family biotin operon repressor/biotin-[acetyl-CoA-carboxylase] ligase
LNLPRRDDVRFDIRRFAEVTSTNDVAAEYASRGAAEGLVVVAEAQTAGRGRLGRSWHSPPGSGLYVSVLLRPEPQVARLLTLAGGVAICEGVAESTGLAPVIKWPNDLLSPEGKRKLAGILVEGTATGQQVEHVVFGFGLNIRAGAYPPDLRGRATSLEEELGRAVEGERVLEFCLAALARRYDDLRQGHAAGVLERWSELAPDARGSRIEWQRDGQVVRGVSAGIDSDGALLARTEQGTERIVSGEVTWCFSQ